MSNAEIPPDDEIRGCIIDRKGIGQSRVGMVCAPPSARCARRVTKTSNQADAANGALEHRSIALVTASAGTSIDRFDACLHKVGNGAVCRGSVEPALTLGVVGTHRSTARKRVLHALGNPASTPLITLIRYGIETMFSTSILQASA